MTGNENSRVQDLMAVDRVQIHSLIPALLANDSQQGDAKKSMALVPPRFLYFHECLTRSLLCEVGDGEVRQSAVRDNFRLARQPVLEVVDGVVVHGLVVIEDAYRHQGSDIAQVPVRVVKVLLVVVMVEEIPVVDGEDIIQRRTKSLLARLGPAWILPQELGRVGKLVPVEARSQVHVLAAVDADQGGAPAVQDLGCVVRVGRVASYQPSEGELVRGMGITVCISIVLRQVAVRAADKDFLGRWGPAGLGQLCGLQVLPGSVPRLFLGPHMLLDSFEVFDCM